VILLQSTTLFHQNLLIAIILISIGFLGMLLQRNRWATIFSLMIWLQGAGLILAAAGQYQGSRSMSVYFLLILLFVSLLMSAMAALCMPERKKPQSEQVDSTSPTAPLTDEGAQTGG